MNNKLKIILVLLSVFVLSGCVVRLQDENKKNVVSPTTGQTLTKNILCLPEDEEILNIYETNKVDLSELPTCQKFPLSGTEYEGLWTSFFVRPLAFLMIKVGSFVGNYGVAIMLVTLLIRTIMFPLTKKSAEQSEKMKKAKPDLDAIEKKYKDKKDRESVYQKSNEIALVYKKHDIGLMSGVLFSFIQLPLFLAFYESMVRLPVIFEETFLIFNLGTTPMKAISLGNYHYIIFIVLVGIATYYSFKLTGAIGASKEQEQMQKNMMKFMIGLIFLSTLILPAGLALYWITNNIFTIAQNLISKWRIK
jgi:YidC/Oxa1 family membrane protein insertase